MKFTYGDQVECYFSQEWSLEWRLFLPLRTNPIVAHFPDSDLAQVAVPARIIIFWSMKNGFIFFLFIFRYNLVYDAYLHFVGEVHIFEWNIWRTIWISFCFGEGSFIDAEFMRCYGDTPFTLNPIIRLRNWSLKGWQLSFFPFSIFIRRHSYPPFGTLAS